MNMNGNNEVINAIPLVDYVYEVATDNGQRTLAITTCPYEAFKLATVYATLMHPVKVTLARWDSITGDVTYFDRLTGEVTDVITGEDANEADFMAGFMTEYNLT